MINILSLIALALTILFILFIGKKPMNMRYIKSLSILLFSYKIMQYTYLSFTQGLTYPVEISTVTYFLFSFIVILGKERLFHIASFFGILSGFGYFIYYSIWGSVATYHLGTYDLIIALISHGIVFSGGVYLFRRYYLNPKHFKEIYITIFIMILHAFIFYYNMDSGTTFIYNIVKPNYLLSSERPIMNISFFYAALLTGYSIFVYLFYKINGRIHHLNRGII